MQKFKTTNQQNARIDVYILCESIEGLITAYEETRDDGLLEEIHAKLKAYGSFWRNHRGSRSSDDFDGHRVRRHGVVVQRRGVSIQPGPGMSYGIGEIPLSVGGK